jgi:hypothetical protein
MAIGSAATRRRVDAVLSPLTTFLIGRSPHPHVPSQDHWIS